MCFTTATSLVTSSGRGSRFCVFISRDERAGERIGPVRVISLLVGVTLIAIVLWDAFETVVLPRTVSRRLRLTRIYIRATWQAWARIARGIRAEARRER